MAEQNRYTFKELVDIIKRIRRDCPWDSVQTHESLKECLVNETEEVLEGIDLFRETGDSGNFCEELGDLLMLVILQSEIAREKGIFTLDDVISSRPFSPAFNFRTSVSSGICIIFLQFIKHYSSH